MKQLLMAAAATLLSAAPVAAQGGMTAQAVPAQLTLEDAIQIALRNNIAYLQTLDNPRTAEISKLVAFTRMLPVPSASISTGGGPTRNTSPAGVVTGSNSSTQLGFSASFNIWDRGASRTNYRQSRNNVQSSTLEVTSQDIAVRVQVIGQYYAVQQEERQVMLEKQMLEQRKAELQDLEARFAVARAGVIDKMQAEQAVKEQELQIRNAEDRFAKARLALLEAMGVAGVAEFTLTTPLPPAPPQPRLDPDSLINLALEGNIPLRRQTLALENTRLSVKQTRTAKYFPSIRASANYGRNVGQSGYSALFDPSARTTSLNGNFSFGFSFTDFIDIPLARQRSQAAESQMYEANLSMRAQRLALQRQVRSAIIDIESAYRQLEYYEDAVKGARFRLEVGEEELRAGARDYQYYQRLVDQAAAAERQVLSAQLTVLTRKLALDQLLGIRPGS